MADITFTKLTDVTLVEEPMETANVLIEEDGVIKKAPKSAVGGGNTEWDAVFTVDDIYNISADTVHLNSGSFDALKTKLDANDVPRVLIIAYWNYNDYKKSCVEAHVEYNITDDVFDIYFHSNWGDSSFYSFSIASDGTISGE